MSHAFMTDAMKKSQYRNQVWCSTYLKKILEDLKEKRARGVDKSIRHADTLQKILSEPAAKPIPVPLRELVRKEDDSMMMAVEPEVLDIFYKSTEKGGDELYLKARNRKAPDDKYYFRLTTSWDYGWQQKQSKQRARDVNFGRKAILRETFYRKNNLAPDPKHYSSPSGAEVGICSEYLVVFFEDIVKDVLIPKNEIARF